MRRSLRVLAAIAIVACPSAASVASCGGGDVCEYRDVGRWNADRRCNEATRVCADPSCVSASGRHDAPTCAIDPSGVVFAWPNDCLPPTYRRCDSALASSVEAAPTCDVDASLDADVGADGDSSSDGRMDVDGGETATDAAVDGAQDAAGEGG